MKDKKGGINWLSFLTILFMVIAIAGTFFRVLRIEQKLGISASTQESAVGLDIGSSVPDLTLVNLDKMVFTLSDVVGERVLLVFSSPDSVFGELYFPKLRAMEDNYPDIRIVMISTGISSENQTLQEKYGFDFPILEWTEETAQAYKVPGVPFFYLVDEKGFVEYAGFLADLALLEKVLST